ncbi:MAG TPA: hypothetical protein VHO25_04035, partial [Polyangiaceae bacterium]|nr:hypothetical protein [Polyangiaceae bacterium]
MNHPCVVVLSQHSRPRVLLSGKRLMELKLPAGTRCLYPRKAASQVLLDEHAFDPALSLLSRNEDELSSREYATLRARVARGRLNPTTPQTREALAAIAGTSVEKLRVPVASQADVLVVGTPVASALLSSNPLQMQGELLGWLCGGDVPLVKRGGTLIVTHPFTDAFDHRRDAAHYDFVHRLLPKTQDTALLRERHEAQFVRDPALLSMHAQGEALHPARAFFDWCRGEAARRHLGRLIAVGADNE